MSVTIKRIRFSELENDPDFEILCEENANESHIKGMPPISIHRETYRKFDQSGLFFIFGAYDGDRLIGFLSVIATLLPHYGVLTAMSESFFVRKADRKSGAGLKLLDAGERFAEELGAPGFFLSAPVGGVLAKVLPRRGYTKTNEVFFKVGK